MRLRNILFVFLWCCVSIVYPQMSLNAGGADASGASGSVSFSIGEPFFMEHESGGFFLSEGIQQSYSYPFVDIPSAGILQSLVFYPNPVDKILNVLLPDDFSGEFLLRLFDISGQFYKSMILQSGLNSLDVSDLNSGQYIVRVKDGDAIYSFKVVKQ